jgi:hypothetical protein
VDEVRDAMGEMINVYKILIANQGGNRPLKRSSHMWKNNMKIFGIRFGGYLFCSE